MGRGTCRRVAVVVAIAASALSLTGRSAATPTVASVLSNPHDIATGSDGALWVTDERGLVRVTTSGKMTRALDVQGGAWRIVEGPDRALWFTAPRAMRIGRLVPGGQPTYYGLGRTPDDVAAGPDGNVWFTADESGPDERGRVGRITPAGAVTEFGDGLRAQSVPGDVTAGPDGNVWFTDRFGRIGRVTPSGAIREFELPDTNDTPTGIVAGRDGRLWFGLTDRVGNITTKGRIRTYGSPLFDNNALVRGPDGKVWLVGDFGTITDTAVVARIDRPGRIRTFSRGFTGTSADALTVGPSGRDLWVVETGRTGDHVVRFSSRHRRATEFPPPPPCRVPSVVAYPRLWVQVAMFDALCRLDRADERAARRRGTIALDVSPRPGTVLPYGARVHVHFGRRPPLPRHCAVPFAGKALASTPGVLVYSYTRYDPTDLSASRTTYGACRRPHGRHRVVSGSTSDLLFYSEASRFELAGTFVAYRYLSEDHYNESTVRVVLYDVATGRRLFSKGVESHEGDFGPDPPDNPVLGEYAVSVHGALAWLSVAGSTATLWAHVRSGERQLDQGKLDTLRFDGDTLYWRHDGQERSAVVAADS